MNPFRNCPLWLSYPLKVILIFSNNYLLKLICEWHLEQRGNGSFMALSCVIGKCQLIERWWKQTKKSHLSRSFSCPGVGKPFDWNMFQMYFSYLGGLFHEMYQVNGGTTGIDWTLIILASLCINVKNCIMYSCSFHTLAYRITHATLQKTAVPCNEITLKSVASSDAFCLLCVPNSSTFSLQFMITSPIANKSSRILGTKSIIKVVVKYVRVQTVAARFQIVTELKVLATNFYIN